MEVDLSWQAQNVIVAITCVQQGNRYRSDVFGALVAHVGVPGAHDCSDRFWQQADDTEG